VTRRLVLAVPALLLTVLVPVPGHAATSSTLTVSSSGNAAAVLHLSAGTRLAWSNARLTTRGHYAAVVLDRLVPDRAHGAVTAALAQGSGLPTTRTAPSDSSSYPAGFYRVYTVGDAPLSLQVTVSGMPSLRLHAEEPFRPTVHLAQAGSSSTPVRTQQSDVGKGPQAVISLVRWDLRRPLGPYQAGADLCATTTSACSGPTTSEKGVSLELNGSSALSSSLITVRTDQAETRVISHLTGNEQPSQVRMLALGVPLRRGLAPLTSGALQVAAAVYGAHDDDSLLVGRLGSRLHAVYIGVGEGPAGIQDPSVSPDGTQVAFVESGSAGGRVAVVFADGSAHRWLTPVEWGQCMSFRKPLWSPDSSRLYVVAYAMCKGGASRVWTVIADGAHTPTPLRLPTGALPTAVSQDGSHLLLTLPGRPGERWSRTGLVRSDGTGLRTFGTQGTMGFALSPSGRTIAAAQILGEGDDKVRIQAQLIDVASARTTPLPVTQPSRGWGSARPLAFSPDGAYLYYQWYGYQADGRDSPTRLFRITTRGTNRTDLTPAIGDWYTALSLQPRHG
jgi:hypothetical protein